jgi:hypothetical protein
MKKVCPNSYYNFCSRDHVKGLKLIQLSDIQSMQVKLNNRDVELVWHYSRAKINNKNSMYVLDVLLLEFITFVGNSKS